MQLSAYLRFRNLSTTNLIAFLGAWLDFEYFLPALSPTPMKTCLRWIDIDLIMLSRIM